MAEPNPLLSVIDLQPSPDKPDIVVSALCRNGKGIALTETAQADHPESLERLHRELASQCAALPD